MPYLQSTYHSKLYRDFQEIDRTAYRQVIRFYEEKEDEIAQLEFTENFELLNCYVNSLFEIGAYRRHLLMVDLVIELSIQKNVQFFRGEDVFHNMLFKKAASLYNMLEYDQADYILRELIKIDPYDQDVILFLKKCLRKKHPGLVRSTRAASIFFFLMTAMVICLEVLFIRPFYKMHVYLIETTRTTVFGLGVAILIGGDLIHRWQVEKEVNTFVSSVKERK